MTTNDVPARLHHDMMATLEDIATNLPEPETLSEEQKFAVCCAVGIPFDTSFDPVTRKFKMTTINDCGIAKIGGRYTVFTRETPISR